MGLPAGRMGRYAGGEQPGIGIMDFEFRNTRHQVARGTRPDAEKGDRFYLFKNVTSLAATYQIRLLTFLAVQQQKKLIIRVPKVCKAKESLRRLMADCPQVVKIERV
jgi:hypothetical protein